MYLMYLLLIVLLFQINGYLLSECECTKNLKNTTLKIKTETTIKIAAVGEPIFIECCAEGFDELQWSFKKEITTKKDLCSNNQCTNENMCLNLRNITLESFGYYTCRVSDKNGNSRNHTTELKKVCKNEYEINLIRISTKVPFAISDPVSICCEVKVNSKEEDSISWTTPWLLDDISLDKFEWGTVTINKTIIRSYECFNNIYYKTCVNIYYMLPKYAGNFTCHFRNSLRSNDYTTSIEIRYDIYPYIVISIGTIVLIAWLVVHFWFFYFDILFYKTKSTGTSKRIVIFYDNEDTKLNVFVTSLSYDLEIYNINTYVYNRDKIMGKLQIEEYQEAADNASLVIFIISPGILLNEDFMFISRKCLDKCIVLYSVDKNRLKRCIEMIPNEYRVYYAELMNVKEKWYLKSYHFSNKTYFTRRMVKWILYNNNIIVNE